ncbi:hypothetical protein SHIRM173S_08613 [Streptomyces hirsutus]
MITTAPNSAAAVIAAATTQATTVTMMISGARDLSDAPTAVPSALPVPAATPTTARDTAALCPLIGCSRSRNARKKIRNPVRQRMDALAASAWVTAGPTVRRPGRLTGWRCGPCRCVSSAASSAVSSPFAESTFDGSVNDSTVPVTNRTNAPYSGQRGPIWWSPAPIGAAMPVASNPPRVTRELAFTRENAGGSSRGTTALLTTPYAFEETSTPRAAGYSWMLPVTTAPDSTRARTARASIAPAIAARRPCGRRSRSGPTTGARSVNGAIVMAR